MPFHPDARRQLPTHGGELLLVRHGQSTANALGIAQGRADYPLSDRGREQAAITGRRLAALGGIGALYASPLGRAAQTAEAIGEAIGLGVIHVPSLVEVDVGAFSGKTWAELAAAHPEAIAAYEAAEAERPHPKNRELLPGWEPIDAVVDRIWRAVLELVAAHPGGRIAVVSHGAVINAFLTHLLDADARETPWRHQQRNCAVNHVLFGPAGPEARCLRDDAHLQAAATPAPEHTP